MPPTGVEPVLCRQKGILSPSCLPAFGKFIFCSLYRLIYHCERDFSSASERDSHFFNKIILPPFSLHVNHVKLFHLVVLDLRSVRDPGLPPGAFALPRCAPQDGGDKGVDEGLIGTLMDGIERNQKPLTPENTLAVTHHDKQKQVEVKRSSRANPHEIRLFSGCPYAVVKQGTKNLQKNKPYKGFSRFRTDLSLVGLTCALYVLFLIVIMLHGHPFCYAAD